LLRRRRTLALSSAVAALVAIGVSGGPAGAGTNSKPDARTVFKKLPATTKVAGPAARASATTAADEGEGEENEAEMVKLRGEYQQSITAAPGTVAPAAGLLAAQAAANRLPAYPGSWREVTDKPFLNDPINRGFNYGVGHYIVTGRMTSFTTSRGVVYAGSASGGVWRSTDLGLHWTTVNRGLPRLAIGALATDPKDGSIWVGTGEANNASENQYGVGTYRLVKGSSTWRKVGGSELNGAGSHRIRWINGYVYIATSHGLYRRSASAPSSKAWVPVLQPNGLQVYPPTSAVTDVLPLPGTGGRKILADVGADSYVSTADTAANGFYVGTGAPGSFSRLTLTGDIDQKTMGRATFSSSGRWLYTVVANNSLGGGDLLGQGAYVSTSGNPAGPWKKIADPLKLYNSDSALDPPPGYFPGAQADYNQYILADPADPKHVYLQLEEVYESVDGGQTWKTVGPYWNFEITCEEKAGDPYDCPPTTHPDQHAGMIYKGQFWAGNDGGVWRRPVSWHDRGNWTNLNATLHTTQNYSIDVGKVPGGLAYWGGLQDNGESYTRTNMSTAEQAFTGDGTDTIVDPNNGDRAVEGYVFMDWYKTTDAAVTTLEEISPSCITAIYPPAFCDPNPRFVAPLEKDVRNPDHWVTGGQYVWDDTKSWATVCHGVLPDHTAEQCDWKKVYDLGEGHQATALAANGDTTYAAWCGPCNPPGFARGLATNYGGTWHQLSLTGVPNRYITSVAVDPGNAAHAYISLGSYSRRWIPDAGIGHVFETRNSGASWRDVSGNLPDAPVFKVAYHEGKLVVGTEVGAFIGGQPGRYTLWTRLGTGLPKVTVWDLVVTPSGKVEAGTHGRGDWELQLRH